MAMNAAGHLGAPRHSMLKITFIQPDGSEQVVEAEPGVTFMERAVHVLREAGCRYVVAVVNEAEDWSARLADVAGAAVIINDRPSSHQIDSIRLGLAWLPDDADAAAILPVGSSSCVLSCTAPTRVVRQSDHSTAGGRCVSRRTSSRMSSSSGAGGHPGSACDNQPSS